MASSDVLNETLHAVTGIKLSQLEKQKRAYEDAKRNLLQKVDDETDKRKRVRVLLDGAKKLPAMTPLLNNPVVSLSNIYRFEEQAAHDPSVSSIFLEDYENTVREQLDVQSNKYSFATLYGQLVTDWTSSGSASAEPAAGSDSGSDYVSVGRDEMHKQRATWEQYVFNAKETDTVAINAYLDKLFADNPSKEVTKEFASLKENVINFQKDWDKETVHFTEDTVSGCIHSILRSDIVSDRKRAALNDFLNNKIVLKEIADVLNMRMATKESFECDGITTIEQRRQLNGRYRFFPDEDLLQTIFLQYVGLKWGSEMRRLLRTFLLSFGVLKAPAQKLLPGVTRRREHFLGRGNGSPRRDNLVTDIDEHWKNEILLDQLPKQMFETRGSYGDDKEAEKLDGDDRSSPLAVIQELLNRVQSGVILQTRMGNNVTVIRSDFKWFGPSLPHSSIFTVLKYFGVQEDWLNFFKKVLEAPVAFKDDGVDSEGRSTPQIRKRGTPIGTPISAFLGEAVLFCSDFAVNQYADGARLYRLHDDLWMWGDVNTCVAGWKALSDFTDIMGLEFNESKTGSCTIIGRGNVLTQSGLAAETSSRLPKGDVTWGFLKLDAASGRFLINQEKVDMHIEELSLQLRACKSVFDFVQAWNLYGVRYFRTNSGQIAACLGRSHVDSMLETFKRIQARVFNGDSSTGSVGQHVKGMIQKLVGKTHIPDGFLYYPASMGGLGLQNPFVDLYLVRNQVVEDPNVFMDEFFEAEQAKYRERKAAFDARDTLAELHDESGRLFRKHQEGIDKELAAEPFFSFEEFSQHREVFNPYLYHAHKSLLTAPTEHNVKVHGEAEMFANHMEANYWSSYQRWVVQLYAKEIMTNFGSLNIVEEGLLPIGMIKMLRKSRFQWQN